ncbi:hypothetical protein SNOG_02803 [Parastagonospora nodorum SN15]|uniref:Uncharacterized protein n=1 Tax=Phaeosphaeria nodorum (strain SN15 / ATCC MYA-4574 / FGSC 10173) TaxID=321614 RepID=Q0UZL1_PHANO|nr:hypothetical protein SNOG_02803 [Parastagonospora nodorum SN15]EAT89534.1 hypothetical protein SNOG_02803 [Parastagonospora nodorum SN15]
MAFFDNIGAGEIATHITADANMIRQVISERDFRKQFPILCQTFRMSRYRFVLTTHFPITSTYSTPPAQPQIASPPPKRPQKALNPPRFPVFLQELRTKTIAGI